MGVCVNLWICLNEVKPHVMYDVEGWMPLEPMQWNRASSQFDLVHTVLFHFSSVISVSFCTCDSVLGNSLEFRQANQDSIRV